MVSGPPDPPGAVPYGTVPAAFYLKGEEPVQTGCSRLDWLLLYDWWDWPCGLGLCKSWESCSLGENIADKFMVLFQPSFLPGSHRVTVKDKSMWVLPIFTFKDRRILERSPIICQDHGKSLEYRAGPREVYRKSKTSVTAALESDSMRKRSIKEQLRKKSVRRIGELLPPAPSTTSIFTTERSGWSAMYCSKSRYVRPIR